MPDALYSQRGDIVLAVKGGRVEHRLMQYFCVQIGLPFRVSNERNSFVVFLRCRSQWISPVVVVVVAPAVSGVSVVPNTNKKIQNNIKKFNEFCTTLKKQTKENKENNENKNTLPTRSCCLPPQSWTRLDSDCRPINVGTNRSTLTSVDGGCDAEVPCHDFCGNLF